jgi:hypothetical protein
VFIPSLSLSLSWKLSSSHSIVAAELYAILQALLFVSHNFHPQSVVIFTDSLTSLHILSSHFPKSYHFLFHAIHNILLTFSTNPDWQIHFQWVPAHVGIAGNEMADKIASVAHSSSVLTDLPLSFSDYSALARQACSHTWDVDISPFLYTSAIGQYRTDSSPAPWLHTSSRPLSTAVTRLRIGHTKLFSHLYRLGMVASPLCPFCPDEIDSISHLLLHCPHFHAARRVFRGTLVSLGVDRFDLPTLLDGRPFPIPLRFKIINGLHRFLRSTDLLERI